MVWPAVLSKRVICELFSVPIKFWGRGVLWGHRVLSWLKMLKLCENELKQYHTPATHQNDFIFNLVKPNVLMFKTHGFKMSIWYPPLGSHISHCCSGKIGLVHLEHLYFNLKDDFALWKLFFFPLVKFKHKHFRHGDSKISYHLGNKIHHISSLMKKNI